LKDSIVVSIPLVWGFRNVIKSGLYRQLSETFRVILAVPSEGRDALLNEGISEDDLWILVKPTRTQLYDWILRLLRSAHERRNPTPSDKILGGWARRGNTIRKSVRDQAVDHLGVATAFDPVFTRLERWEVEAFVRTIPRSIFEFLQQAKPVAALSTSYILDWEWPLFRALRVLNIPTLTHVLSFDNLTSSGYLPVKHFDHYLVWQSRMADELRTFYSIPNEKITVTGTPQFDFHVQPRFVWSREMTARVLGIEDTVPYIAYCANHSDLTPSEPDLVRHLVEELSRDSSFRDHQWILRLHPMDQYERWEELRRFSNITISHPWRRPPGVTFWGAPSDSDLALLGNTLRHADATLTIASTAALDSAVVDTPVVCLGFHPKATSEENKFYYDMHLSHHFRPILESGAAPLATSMESAKELLKDAIRRRSALGEARAKLAEQLCGPVDGRSGQRIAEALSRLARSLPGQQENHRSERKTELSSASLV
jgi:hypothetical protein